MRDLRRAGLRIGLISLAAALGLATSANAVTVNDAAGLSAAAAAGDPFGSVVRLAFDDGVSSGVCSGALIAPGAVLTADHCVVGFSAADVTVEFRAGAGALEATRGVGAVFVLGDPYDGGNLLDGGDLAVLALSTAVEDRDPFPLFSDLPLGATGRLVGYGRHGLGSTGAGPIDLVRRAADATVDAYGAAPIPYAPGTTGIGSPTRPQFFSGSENILSADFDDGLDDATGDGSNKLWHVGSSGAMLPLEGSGAPGDSGGPLLIRTGLAWAIAGVLSGGSGLSGNPLAGYGDVAYWTGVRSAEATAFLSGFEGVRYVAAVPLPAPAGLLLAGAVALAGVAVRRRRASVERG
ncbi:MAG: trypsin-like serine protease [Paracoccaceae bacterium]